MIISSKHFYKLLESAKESADYINQQGNRVYIEFWQVENGVSYQYNVSFEFVDLFHAKPIRVSTLIYEYEPKFKKGKQVIAQRLPVVTCWVHNAQTFQLSNLCYIQE